MEIRFNCAICTATSVIKILAVLFCFILSFNWNINLVLHHSWKKHIKNQTFMEYIKVLHIQTSPVVVVSIFLYFITHLFCEPSQFSLWFIIPVHVMKHQTPHYPTPKYNTHFFSLHVCEFSLFITTDLLYFSARKKTKTMKIYFYANFLIRKSTKTSTKRGAHNYQFKFQCTIFFFLKHSHE